MSGRICVLSQSGVCVANISLACLCRQMDERVYRQALQQRMGPPCDHSGWKGVSVHGRCCPDCGQFMVDFGD